MTDTIKLFKLTTGDQIVAMVDIDSIELDEHIKLLYPIEVLTEFSETSRGLNERFNLKPWQSLSSSDSITINNSVILYMTELKTEYVSEYMAIVEHFYLRRHEEVELEDELPNLIPDDSVMKVH